MIKRWIKKIIHDVMNEPKLARDNLISDAYPSNTLDTQRGIILKIHFASGGKVVECQSEGRGGSINRNLYIITEDKKFGDEIEKICTMEGLRR